jgi:hypothetical protein
MTNTISISIVEREEQTVCAVKAYARKILGRGRWGVQRETGVEGKSGIWSVWSPPRNGDHAQSKRLEVWAYGDDVRPVG